MSTFAVSRERIGEIRPIPKADRIEIATLQGMDFQFVVGKGEYKPGDEVLYIPVDSILPSDLVEHLGLKGKLAGPEQNRVKTVVLRGVYSQGVVAPVHLVPFEVEAPAEITELLGITKWNPVPNEVPDGILMPKPEGQSTYDIESADRYVDLAGQLMDQPVFITEKMEGENAWVTASPDGVTLIGMRDNTIHEKEGVPNRFHTAMKSRRVTEFAAALCTKYRQRITVYGEYLSAGGYYQLEKPTVLLFDIRVQFRWLSPVEFLSEVRAFYGNTDLVVPILLAPNPGITLRQWLEGKTVKQASDGPSALVTKRREGIVIKPLSEDRDDRIGRLVLKQRSPAYLANSDL